MATVVQEEVGLRRALGRYVASFLVEAGDMAVLAVRVVSGVRHGAGRGTLVPIGFAVGVRSIPVVAITGMFIGMVMAVESYGQFAALGLATRLGSIINISVVRELGPVLAATMLAGRIGGAMAAELATMRTTEQIDALACLGVSPDRYLGTPRFLACVGLIPMLTVIANFMGVLGGAIICLGVYGVEPHFYWENTQGHIGLYDVFTGLIKSLFFGAAIAVISCHHGIHSEPGAEGVGRASTKAFVASFIAILALDFFLALLLSSLYRYLYAGGSGKLI